MSAILATCRPWISTPKGSSSMRTRCDSTRSHSICPWNMHSLLLSYASLALSSLHPSCPIRPVLIRTSRRTIMPRSWVSQGLSSSGCTCSVLGFPAHIPLVAHSCTSLPSHSLSFSLSRTLIFPSPLPLYLTHKHTYNIDRPCIAVGVDCNLLLPSLVCLAELCAVKSRMYRT